MNTKQKINGSLVGWSDIDLLIFGVPIVGFTEINYDKDNGAELVYAGGPDPYGIGYGNKQYSASITLMWEEWKSIQSALPPGKDVTDAVPFTWTLLYELPDGSSFGVRFETCIIKKYSQSHSQGNTHFTVSLELVVGKIVPNI